MFWVSEGMSSMSTHFKLTTLYLTIFGWCWLIQQWCSRHRRSSSCSGRRWDVSTSPVASPRSPWPPPSLQALLPVLRKGKEEMIYFIDRVYGRILKIITELDRKPLTKPIIQLFLSKNSGLSYWGCRTASLFPLPLPLPLPVCSSCHKWLGARVI